MKRKKRVSDKGRLIKGVLEKQPAGVLKDMLEDLQDIIKTNCGIYALYNGNKLYRVGLASQLIKRVPSYLKSKTHKGKWNNFSVFIIKRQNYLKDLETLVLRIAKPEGNKVLGKIPRHHEMERKLRSIINKYKRIARAYERNK